MKYSEKKHKDYVAKINNSNFKKHWNELIEKSPSINEPIIKKIAEYFYYKGLKDKDMVQSLSNSYYAKNKFGWHYD
jgi:hypothetical protein